MHGAPCCQFRFACPRFRHPLGSLLLNRERWCVGESAVLIQNTALHVLEDTIVLCLGETAVLIQYTGLDHFLSKVHTTTPSLLQEL